MIAVATGSVRGVDVTRERQDGERLSVDWSLASRTGRLLAGGGPSVSPQEAADSVGELRRLSVVAESHVRDVTGLGADLPLLPGDVVDRAGWVTAASTGLAAVTEGAVPSPTPAVLAPVLARSAGVQAGVVLGFLASRVLGQYDPFGTPDGRLLLVAPNVMGAQQALRVPPTDFRLWVCLHESTHRLQFTAVPWLRSYFAEQVRQLLASMEDLFSGGSTRLPELLSAVRGRTRSGSTAGGPIGLIELLQTPQQREILHRLLALSTLLEGHADHVMDAVGPSVVPSVVTIRERFTERRKGGGVLDRLLRVLLGVDAKIKQYAEGAAFTRHVVDAAGMGGFNAVWRAPETLPTHRELTDPDAWLRRVEP